MTWDCVAYGEGSEEFAPCFVGGDRRVCDSVIRCQLTMAVERDRVWRRLQELGAGGDPTALYLLDQFSGPGDLLGGSDAE